MVSHSVLPNCSNLSEFFKTNIKEIDIPILLDPFASVILSNKMISRNLGETILVVQNAKN
jgi:hypothetical protein